VELEQDSELESQQTTGQGGTGTGGGGQMVELLVGQSQGHQ